MAGRCRIASAVALLALAVGAPAAEAAERVLLTQKAQTRVKAWGGKAIFSRWDGTLFHLAMSEGGRPPVDLPVPPQRAEFDADIGPDARGRAVVALSRCDAAGDCDLHVLRVGTSRLSRVAGASRPRRIETRPSISRGRIAWAQRSRSESRHTGVFTRRLTDPASVRSTALPGLPRAAWVEELELGGRRLALLTQTEGGVCGRLDVRLLDVRSRRSRTVASQTCGLNGQSWAGPTFHRGWLYFARYCHDAEACALRKYGAVRYRLSTRRFQIANFERLLTGWAYAGNGRAYEARDAGGECHRDDLGGTCEVVWVSGLRFVPIDRSN